MVFIIITEIHNNHNKQVSISYKRIPTHSYYSFKMNPNMALVVAIENMGDNVPRQIINYVDAFRMSDDEFKKNFRLTKVVSHELIEMLTPYIQEKTRASGLSIERKVLAALNFFATGSYQTGVGKNVLLGMSQASVSRSVNEVTEALNRPEIFTQWVHFPGNIEEMNDLRQKFYNKYRMPGVVGCIDCTHVAIFPPPTNHPHFPENIFVNRKNYHSINVQLICDVDLTIYHVNARFPGSCHDSHIWNTSNAQQVLRNIYNQIGEGYFLLGDSGYALRPWLLTPLENPQGEREERYNVRHKCARATIERVNGILKMRFRCLLKHRVLHYNPTMASKIIHACVVLHNMCIANHIEIEEDDDFDFGIINQPLNEPNDVNNARVNPELAAGRKVQRKIINQIQD